MILMVALTGAMGDFYNCLTVRLTASSMYAQVVRAQSCANHVQRIEFLPHAKCHVPCGMKLTDQISRLTEFKFVLAVVYWLKP